MAITAAPARYPATCPIPRASAVPRPADERHPAFEDHEDQRDTQPLPHRRPWLAPIAAATAKESRPSGSTKASSFSTGSGSHGLQALAGVACQTGRVTSAGNAARSVLLRRGFALEYVTLAWNVAGIVVLAIAAAAARSVALAGFGLDSLIEIGASTVVIWELSGTGAERQRRGLRLIGYAFAALAVYLLVQSTVVLATGYHPRHSVPGIIWTAVTAVVMFALASGKARTGRALGNPVLQTEGRVTMIDGILAAAVLAGLVLNAGLGWWWADPAAGYVLVYYATREVRKIFFGEPSATAKA